MSSDSFVLAADKSPTLANNFLTRAAFVSQLADRLCRRILGIPDQRFGWRGDGIPKAAGSAKPLMKNLPRAGCRKSPGEDFDFLQLSADSALKGKSVANA